MAEILVVPSIPDITPGEAEHVLAERGVAVRFFDYERDQDLSAQDFDGILALGSPFSVNDREARPGVPQEAVDQMAQNRRIIHEALNGKRKVPTLGFCSGAQLIADAVDARVVPADPPENGMCPVPGGEPYKMRLTDAGRASRFFRGVAEEVAVFQVHHEMIDAESDPSGRLKVAALGNVCANQAIIVDDIACGLQGHNELLPEKLPDWAANAEDLQGLDYDQLRADFMKTYPERRAFIRQVSNNFVDIVNASRVN